MTTPEQPPERKRRKQINRKPAFLAAFRATLQLTAAADTAGIALHTHYDWLKSDPQYRIDYENARNELAQKLEDVAYRHAFEGTKKALYYRGKPVFHGKTRSYVYETEYDHHLLLAVLRRLRPDDWRERNEVQVTGSLDLVERLHAGRQRLLEMKKAEDDSIAG